MAESLIAAILIGILDAVKHAERIAGTGVGLALARAPIAADDVFLSYTGDVQLLGFKSCHARPRAARGGGSAGLQPPSIAIDALLEQQLTPRPLMGVSARVEESGQEVRKAGRFCGGCDGRINASSRE